MACNCGKKNGTTATTYVVTTANGNTLTYSTEIEAIAAASRLGGTWRVQ